MVSIGNVAAALAVGAMQAANAEAPPKPDPAAQPKNVSSLSADALDDSAERRS